MAYAKIRPKRGTTNQWETANTILAEGEIGIEFPNTGVGTGPIKIKQGNGVTPWNSLPYAVDNALFKSLDSIGIVDTATSQEICASLPDGSSLAVSVTSAQVSDIPTTENDKGILQIVKSPIGVCSATFVGIRDGKSALFSGTYVPEILEEESVWTGWNEFISAAGGIFSDKIIAFSSPSSDGLISMYNGGDPTLGAAILLYGIDNSHKGKFRIQAYDPQSEAYRVLDGFPNGDLQWNGGFINPAMVIGTEYKTAERHQNKPVYAKLLNGGTMPNASSKTVDISLSPSKVVSLQVVVTDGTYALELPYIFATGEVRAIGYIKNTHVTLATMADLSAYTAIILVKYTK